MFSAMRKIFLCISLMMVGMNLTSASSLVYDLLGSHIEIGLHEARIDITDSSLKGQISSFSWNSLISELDRAKTVAQRRKILKTYIGICRNISFQAERLIAQEDQEYQFYQNEISQCETNLSYYNEQFSLLINQWNLEKAHEYSLKIADIRACIAKNTVYQKEHLSYYHFYQNQLSNVPKKCDYLENNQDKIAQYYEIMKPDLLRELYDISMTLQVNFGKKND